MPLDPGHPRCHPAGPPPAAEHPLRHRHCHAQQREHQQQQCCWMCSSGAARLGCHGTEGATEGVKDASGALATWLAQLIGGGTAVPLQHQQVPAPSWQRHAQRVAGGSQPRHPSCGDVESCQRRPHPVSVGACAWRVRQRYQRTATAQPTYAERVGLDSNKAVHNVCRGKQLGC